MTDDPFPSAMRRWLDDLDADLQARKRDHNWRVLPRVQSRCEPEMRINSAPYLQFCSNNYLGLAADPRVIDAARGALDRWGFGAGASRLVSGNTELHEKLEADLAQLKKQPAAVILPSGFAANLAALKTFSAPGDLIFSDKLNHASLLDAAAASGADHHTYPHLDYDRLESRLQRFADRHATGGSAPRGRCWLVTDTVFSMDGDVGSPARLAQLADQYDAVLMLDEAHATGVLGSDGAGVAAMENVSDRIALSVGTLSKAFGSAGGFIAGPHAAVDSLINRGRNLIYTTALPAACIAAAQAALDISLAEPWRRERVCLLAHRLRTQLQQMGFECGRSATPIIPIILGSSQSALDASRALAEKGIWVSAIRPPTVKPNSARLRISLMATHTDEHIARLVDAMKDIAPAA
ncbi:MAG: aminotransferase class I/II-fold pyridoxal phosphate-dependent enzyme [Phycisphaerae bacterium]